MQQNSKVRKFNETDMSIDNNHSATQELIKRIKPNSEIIKKPIPNIDDEEMPIFAFNAKE